MSFKQAAKNAIKRVLPKRLHNSLSPTRRMNNLKNLFFRFSSPVVAPPFLYPDFLAIFLTTRCNLRCFICRRENFKGEDLEFENIYKLKNAITHASIIDLTGWGECLIYPRFEEVLKYIYSLNTRRDLISITTNGTRLSGKTAKLLSGHLNRLVISLNAATEDTYNRDMHYGDFEKTINSIKEFMSVLDIADRRKVSLHLVAHTGNFREIPQFVMLAKKLGISGVSLGAYLVGITEHKPYSLLNVKDEYYQVIGEARKIGSELGVQVQGRRFYEEAAANLDGCFEPLNSCYIGVDGQVSPCCYAGSYRIGKVYDEGFESVWFGKAFNELRRIRYLPACRECTPFILFDDPRAHLTSYLKENE